MRAKALALAIAVAVGLHAAPMGGALPDAHDQLACALADSEMWPMRAIDSSPCGADGAGDEKHIAQNRVKNNLCAGGFLTSSPDTEPALVTQLSFRRLQAAADVIREANDLGVVKLPDDRSIFEGDIHTTTEGDEIGEGSLVRYVGFLLEGHFSGEEGVNCDREDDENADIHLAFSNTKPSLSISKHAGEAAECRSITAEIIPRRRPSSWELLGHMKKSGAKPLAGALKKIDAHNLRRPLRITGQLFFDASHQACKDGVRVGGNPGRASNWEIHPVYAIDVCDRTTLSACRWNDDTVWTPLHAWLEEDDQ